MKLIPINLNTVRSFLIVGRGEGLVLVDAGNPGDGEKILREVRQAGYRPADISLVVLTHGHRDHVGGVVELSRDLRAKILIHSKDAHALTRREESPTVPADWKGRALEGVIPSRKAVPEKVEPDEFMEERVNLHGFGVDGEIIHTPGHTEGSLSVILDDGNAVVGDLIMGSLLLFGRASLPFFAVDLDEIKASIEKVLAAEPSKIWPSHGGPYDPEDLRRLL